MIRTVFFLGLLFGGRFFGFGLFFVVFGFGIRFFLRGFLRRISGLFLTALVAFAAVIGFVKTAALTKWDSL